MKVLCKKNYECIDKSPFVDVRFYENQTYEYNKKINSPWHSVIDNGQHRWLFAGVNGWCEEGFHEYFYTPEETKNILRTKLIDKILDESIM